ncbi:hypothetical protein [Acidianus sp. RZ1]|uniref:hypothetical protein n=1 Tax=Acidianus sp. RZ1 TaxID=1540082 RepID=UPI001492F115|nr:hypothetical protein [Acidianus sp. RZ1]NON62368.1 hypothetical protein [Acidianus sp. RZ1]
MDLRVELPEDVIIPPLSEFTFVCDKELSNSKCSERFIFRDMDLVSFSYSDVIYNMSLLSIVRSKTFGRKRARWLSYIKKYKISILPEEFSTIIRTNGLVTIYVDGYELDEVNGEAIIKEIKLVNTGRIQENSIEALTSIKPRLIVISNLSNYWTSITAYKVTYIEQKLKGELSSLSSFKRMDCEKIELKQDTRICYTSTKI